MSEVMTLEELREFTLLNFVHKNMHHIIASFDAAIRERDELCKVRDYFELNAPPTPEHWHEMCARAEQAESALAAMRSRR